MKSGLGDLVAAVDDMRVCASSRIIVIQQGGKLIHIRISLCRSSYVGTRARTSEDYPALAIECVVVNCCA